MARGRGAAPSRRFASGIKNRLLKSRLGQARSQAAAANAAGLGVKNHGQPAIPLSAGQKYGDLRRAHGAQQGHAHGPQGVAAEFPAIPVQPMNGPAQATPQSHLPSQHAAASSHRGVPPSHHAPASAQPHAVHPAAASHDTLSSPAESLATASVARDVHKLAAKPDAKPEESLFGNQPGEKRVEGKLGHEKTTSEQQQLAEAAKSALVDLSPESLHKPEKMVQFGASAAYLSTIEKQFTEALQKAVELGGKGSAPNAPAINAPAIAEGTGHGVNGGIGHVANGAGMQGSGITLAALAGTGQQPGAPPPRQAAGNKPPLPTPTMV